jgi:hypothetical protein
MSLNEQQVISDRRINAGFDNKGDQCKLNPTNSQLSDMQYTWGWLVNSANKPSASSFKAPDAAEMARYGNSSRPWVKSWNEGQEINPFYKYRPKLPFVDQTRADGKLNPLYPWNFNEEAFRPYNDELAWIPSDYSATYVHEVTLKAATGDPPEKGRGIMGVGTPKK